MPLNAALQIPTSWERAFPQTKESLSLRGQPSKGQLGLEGHSASINVSRTAPLLLRTQCS